MIPEEWVKEYLKKSGDEKLPDGKLEILPYGFLIWGLNQSGDFVIVAVYAVNGYGKAMYSFINSLAKKYGCKKLVFATQRRPEPFIRKYGFRLKGYILEKEVE